MERLGPEFATAGSGAAAVLLVALVVSSACSNVAVKSRELPEAPIAFLYHTEEVARRRAEALAEDQKTQAQADPRTAYENRGVVNINDFGNYLDDAFGERSRKEYRGRLALLDARGIDVTVVQGAQPGAVPQAWSPDRRRLLFSQGDPGAKQLYEYDRESSEVGQVTRGPAPHPQGCYASGGRYLITVHTTEYFDAPRPHRMLTSRLAIQSPAGQVEFISSGPSDGDPACSPDGEHVAFVRVFGEHPQVWIQPIEAGAAARPLTPGRDPAYSPDGEWIVFTRSEHGSDGTRIWRIRTDGVGRTRLGTGSGADEQRPVLSPDGRIVVYESVLENRYRLFTRRFDGSGDVVLFSAGDGTHAVW